MNFLFTQYTDVMGWQLVVPWAIVFVLALLAAWGWVLAGDYKGSAEWWERSQNRTYVRMKDKIEDYEERTQILNEKNKSLEAQINRMISRPRGENGRFEGKNKG